MSHSVIHKIKLIMLFLFFFMGGYCGIFIKLLSKVCKARKKLERKLNLNIKLIIRFWWNNV